MSLLWGDNITKLSTYQKKPSPTYHNISGSSARNFGISIGDRKNSRAIKCHAIEGSSPPILLFQKVCAAMTVEATLLLPLLMCFFLSMGSVIEMIRLHGNIQVALLEEGNKLAMYEYMLESGLSGEEQDALWKEIAGKAFVAGYGKARLIERLGQDYLDNSPIVGGAAGLSLWESDVTGADDVIKLTVTYAVRPWGNLPGVGGFRMANQYCARAWTGYQVADEEPEDGDLEEKQVAYLTDNAEVYHLDRSCSYLTLSVREIDSGRLEEARNRYGGRYGPCDKCAEGKMPLDLYITDEGENYHYNRECPGLKRTIYMVLLKEAQAYKPCSRCVQEVGE